MWERTFSSHSLLGEDTFSHRVFSGALVNCCSLAPSLRIFEEFRLEPGFRKHSYSYAIPNEEEEESVSPRFQVLGLWVVVSE